MKRWRREFVYVVMKPIARLEEKFKTRAGKERRERGRVQGPFIL